MSNGEDNNDPAVVLGEVLSLVFSAIEIAEKGLLCNPSVEEGRKLNEQLNDLQQKRAILQAKIDALIAGSVRIAEPTAEQVAEISRLTGQVEALTSRALTASAAVAFSSRVLTVATEALAARPVG